MKFYILVLLICFFLRSIRGQGEGGACDGTSFQKPLYKGQIDSHKNLLFEEEIILENLEGDFNVELIGNHSELFTVSLLENGTIHLDFATINEDDEEGEKPKIPKDVTFIALELKVSDRESKLEASTAIILEIEAPFRPEFPSDLYVGRLTDKLVLKPLVIQLTDETFTIGTYFQLVPRSSEIDDTKYFLCRSVGNRAMIVVSPELTPEACWDRDHLEFNVVATALDGETGITSVVIGVPSQQCLYFPDKPVFEHDSYNFFIKADFKGVIGRVVATVEDPTDKLTYSFRSEDEIMLQLVNVNPEAGSIELLDFLPPNIYVGEIVAINEKSSWETATRLTITVDLEKLCPGERPTTVEHTLVVKRLEEEEAYDDIFDMKLEKCSYEIRGQWPEGTEFFSIDQETSKLKSSKFDREGDYFEGTLIPQFQIYLQLMCPEEKLSNATISNESLSETPGYVAIDGIEYSPEMTIISIVVIDVNDHAPVFETPKDPLKIGYPTAELANKLLTDKLIQVHATDADDGINAQIRYRVDENKHFAINEENGVLFALPNCMATVDQIELIVHAVDRDGADDGLVATIELTVYKLSLEHVVVLTFYDTDNCSESDVVEHVKGEINVNFSVLKLAAVPKYGNNDKDELAKFLLADEDETTTEAGTTVNEDDDDSNGVFYKILIYAFHSSGRLQTAEEVLKEISSSNPSTVFASPATDDYECLPQFEAGDESNTYKILTITFASITGTLLIAVIAAAFCVYFYTIKPLQKQQGDDGDDTSSVASSAVEQQKTSSSNLFIKAISGTTTTHQNRGSRSANYNLERANESSFYPVQLSATIDDGRFSPSESIDSGTSENYKIPPNAEYAIARKPRR